MSESDTEWVCQDCGVTREEYDGTLVEKTSGEVLCLECDLGEDDPDDNFEENVFEVECRDCGTVWLTPEEPDEEICLDCSN